MVLRNQCRNQLQFGVFFQGVNISTIWHWEDSGSQIEFESFRRVAQTAERGVFAAFFLGEGLRNREHLGKIHQNDVAGRPDGQTVEAALAAVTNHIGLVTTSSTTYNDPVDFAYRIASLNQLSEGRSGWNIVTTHSAWVGENFRRGGYVLGRDRYTHAAAFVDAVKGIWAKARELTGTHVSAGSNNKAIRSVKASSLRGSEATGDDLITATEGSLSKDLPRHSSTPTDIPLRIKNQFYDLEVQRFLPLVQNGEPVLFQSGDSAEGRDFGAKYADLVFTSYPLFESALNFALDLDRRARRYGRVGQVKAFPGTFFVIGETKKEAKEKFRHVQESQITGANALSFLEHVWGRDLSEYDPDGPLPEVDPIVVETNETRGPIFQNYNAIETARKWRAIAKENNWSIREFAIQNTSSGLNFYPDGFVGTVNSIADELEKYAHTGIVSGFNITPYLTPTGLDEIVDLLVPELQNRGIYPHDYHSSNFRENLRLGTWIK